MNIIISLGSENTTVIEFNIPWIVETAFSDTNNPRALFYSLGRGVGITENYWFVRPTNVLHKRGAFIKRNPNSGSFYQAIEFSVDIDEILEILKRSHLV